VSEELLLHKIPTLAETLIIQVLTNVPHALVVHHMVNLAMVAALEIMLMVLPTAHLHYTMMSDITTPIVKG
jgi:hypothetical protein